MFKNLSDRLDLKSILYSYIYILSNLCKKFKNLDQNKRQTSSGALSPTDTILQMYQREIIQTVTSSGDIPKDHITGKSDIFLVNVVRFLLFFQKNEISELCI